MPSRAIWILTGLLTSFSNLIVATLVAVAKGTRPCRRKAELNLDDLVLPQLLQLMVFGTQTDIELKETH
jgi:hypothetical protein